MISYFLTRNGEPIAAGTSKSETILTVGEHPDNDIVIKDVSGSEQFLTITLIGTQLKLKCTGEVESLKIYGINFNIGQERIISGKGGIPIEIGHYILELKIGEPDALWPLADIKKKQEAQQDEKSSSINRISRGRKEVEKAPRDSRESPADKPVGEEIDALFDDESEEEPEIQPEIPKQKSKDTYRRFLEEEREAKRKQQEKHPLQPKTQIPEPEAKDAEPKEIKGDDEIDKKRSIQKPSLEKAKPKSIQYDYDSDDDVMGISAPTKSEESSEKKPLEQKDERKSKIAYDKSHISDEEQSFKFGLSAEEEMAMDKLEKEILEGGYEDEEDFFGVSSKSGDLPVGGGMSRGFADIELERDDDDEEVFELSDEDEEEDFVSEQEEAILEDAFDYEPSEAKADYYDNSFGLSEFQEEREQSDTDVAIKPEAPMPAPMPCAEYVDSPICEDEPCPEPETSVTSGKRDRKEAESPKKKMAASPKAARMRTSAEQPKSAIPPPRPDAQPGTLRPQGLIESKQNFIERRATLRYYSQMTTAKNFPLLLIFSKEEIQEIVRKHVAQVESKEKIKIKRDKPVIKIVPQFPGCICVPESIELDLTPAQTEARFWLTPVAEGLITDSHISIYYEGKKIHMIYCPTRVRKSTAAKISASAAIISPVFFSTIEGIGVDPKTQITGGFPIVKQISDALGGMTMMGLIIGIIALIVAIIFYAITKPKKGSPLDNFLSFDVKKEKIE